jgi:hypothetical protein
MYGAMARPKWNITVFFASFCSDFATTIDRNLARYGVGKRFQVIASDVIANVDGGHDGGSRVKHRSWPTGRSEIAAA